MSLGQWQYVNLVPAGVKTTSSVGNILLDVQGYGDLQAIVTLVTTSGTIASAAVWLEGTLDNGENWFPLALDQVIQADGTNASGFIQFGAAGAVGATTAGFYPIL